MKKYIYFSVFLFFCFLSCNRSGGGSRGETGRKKLQISISSPLANERLPIGSTIALSITKKQDAQLIDSLRWFVNGRWLETTKGEDVQWDTQEQTTGTHRIEAVAHYQSGQRDIVSVQILLLAPTPPVRYTYRVVRTFPHDRKAYTQGLLFDSGFLYESTGLTGESSLRKVDLQTGQPIMKIELENEMFGEGLTLVDDKLVQITWKNQTAFVYQKSDFKLLERIRYNIQEGWGLAFDGEHLLMTDGSANLYFLDMYFNEKHRIQVCDHEGPVRNLNELEYIEGELWANIYLTNDIVRIDTKTGVVVGRIDMSGILPNSDRRPDTDVLNGIAYDSENKRIFVTGKNWPKLFEIQIIER
jgi:glutamine cyclotransferase